MKKDVSTRIAVFSEKVMLLRKHVRQEKQLKPEDKNPFTFWYSPRKQTFQAHLQGGLIEGVDLDDLLDNAELFFLAKYNGIFKTKFSVITDCNFEYFPENWSKDKLLEEYLKLKQLTEKAAIKVKRPYNRKKQLVNA